MTAYPTTSAHLSDFQLMLDQYAGGVESQFAAKSIMRQYANVRPVVGTDTIVNNRVGRTTLSKLTPGVRPDAAKTEFGDVSLTVDTVVLARDSRSMLNEFQTHIDARMELAEDHGKEIGKFFDEAFIIQGIKGSLASAPAGLNGSIGAGKNETLVAANDEEDPDKLYEAIKAVIIQMEDEDIDVDELVVFVRPSQFGALHDNNKLTSSDYSSANGDFADATLYKVYGARIVKTNRIPKVANAAHLLGTNYNVSAAEAKAVAVILHPKSLMAGETIPLSSDIFFDKLEKSWFIDSWIAFGVTVSRPDVCGAVFAA